MEYWSELPTIVWISTRDQDLVARAIKRDAGIKSEMTGEVAQSFAINDIKTFHGFGSSMAFHEAVTTLCEAFQSNKISGIAVSEEGLSEPTDPAWFAACERLMGNKNKDGFGFLRKYKRVVVLAADARACWPATEKFFPHLDNTAALGADVPPARGARIRPPESMLSRWAVANAEMAIRDVNPATIAASWQGADHTRPTIPVALQALRRAKGQVKRGRPPKA